MNKEATLFSAFLRNPFRVGAICPSSPALARAITSEINANLRGLIVELGPGTGAITRFICQRSTHQKVLAVELDAGMCGQLRKKYAGIQVFNDSAGNLPKILSGNQLPLAKLIVSGLPWAIFPFSLQKEILSAVNESLDDDGCFATFAYLQGLLMPNGIRFRRLLGGRFARIETSPVVWRNLPPAIIYRCYKKIR